MRFLKVTRKYVPEIFHLFIHFFILLQELNIKRFTFFTFDYERLTKQQNNTQPPVSEPLPIEIVTHILSYLSKKDIFNMCIAKIFFVQINTQPWFRKLIHQLLFHLLIHTDFTEKSLLYQALIIPVIMNEHIYFAVDNYKASYLLSSQNISLSWTTSFDTIAPLLLHPEYTNKINTTTNRNPSPTTICTIKNNKALQEFPCDIHCLCHFYTHINTLDTPDHIPYSKNCQYCHSHFEKSL